MSLSIKAIILSILIFCLAVVAIFSWLFFTGSSRSYTDSNSADDILASKSTSFAEGLSLLEQRKPAEALPAFEAALKDSKDVFQEGAVKFQIAATKSLVDPLASVPLFIDIAMDPSYAYGTRAYALQYLAELYYNPYNDWKAIRDATFKDPRLSDFYKEKNTALAYRRLAEYGASLYSTVIPEVRVADWYADEIVRLHKAGTASVEKVDPYKKLIEERFAQAESDISKSESDASLHRFTPIALQLKAVALRKLADVGEAKKIEVEQAFAEAVGSFDKEEMANGLDGYTRYLQASFIAEAYGKSRSSDVVATIEPLYKNPIYGKTFFGLFVSTSGKTRADARAKLSLLASIDPKFKTFLVLHGWKDSDFK